ncbi:MAG TPA: hypothetical protein VKX49_04375 [Bryobacteraceae bacterium]|nr:hypothetical protein [Bryobacteraceae bacterium]
MPADNSTNLNITYGSDPLRVVLEKYAYAISRDALTNVFRAYWPDIATHVFHRHPWGA